MNMTMILFIGEAGHQKKKWFLTLDNSQVNKTKIFAIWDIAQKIFYPLSTLDSINKVEYDQDVVMWDVGQTIYYWLSTLNKSEVNMTKIFVIWEAGLTFVYWLLTHKSSEVNMIKIFAMWICTNNIILIDDI